MAATVIPERQKWLADMEVVVSDIQCNYNVTLKSFEMINEFFENEKQVWNNLSAEIQKKNQSPTKLQHLRTYFTTITSTLTDIQANITNPSWTGFNTTWNNLKLSIEKPSAPKKFYSKSSHGQFLISVYSKNALIGDGAFKYFDPQQVNAGNGYELEGFIHAHLFANALSNESAKAILATLQQSNNEFQEKSSAVKQHFDKTVAEINLWKEQFELDQGGWEQGVKDELDKYLKEQRENFANLGVSYTEKLKIEGPVQYWRERSRIYRGRGIKWLIGFSIVIIVFVIFLTIILYNPPSVFHFNILNGEPLAVKAIIIFGLIITGLFYLAKVFAKMTFSSFHLERDAEEREQLTMVYLALIKEGKISEKERDVMLQSIFSRVDTGILGEDSSPTMPTIGNLLNKQS